MPKKKSGSGESKSSQFFKDSLSEKKKSGLPSGKHTIKQPEKP